MVLNVGLMWSAPVMRGAAVAGRATARFQSNLLAPSCLFSTASQRAIHSTTAIRHCTLTRPRPQALAAATPRATPLPFSRGFSSSLPGLTHRPPRSETPPPPPPSAPGPATSPPPSSKAALSEDILTLPNLLTMSRLLATPYIGYLVATHQYVPGCILLFVASVTDLLDGWLARRTGRYTVFGSIADPAADKALVTTMVVALAVSGMLPLALAALILGRDAALVVSAFVIRYRTLAPPKTLSRYFNPRLPSASVTPTTISKYNTFLQLLLLGCLTLYPILYPHQPTPGLTLHTEPQASTSPEDGSTIAKAKVWVDPALTALMWITAATTLWSGVGYLGGAGSAKVLAARAQGVSQKVKSSLKPPSSSSSL